MNEHSINDLSEDLINYGRVQARILELELSAKASTASASAVSAVFIAFTLLIAFLFINVGLGLYLSQVLGGYVRGFTFIGGFYALLSFVLIAFRKQLLFHPVRNRIITTMFGKP